MNYQPGMHMVTWGMTAPGGKMVTLLYGCTDWHNIWYTCGESSGNGYTPNKLPLETQGALGFFWGQPFKSLGKLSNGCTDRHQIWYTSADSCGNGQGLIELRPTIHVQRGIRYSINGN